MYRPASLLVPGQTSRRETTLSSALSDSSGAYVDLRLSVEVSNLSWPGRLPGGTPTFPEARQTFAEIYNPAPFMSTIRAEKLIGGRFALKNLAEYTRAR